jgi:hypothetical protein
MQDKNIDKLLPMLIKGRVLAYDLKPDGSLAIIDYKGRKLIYPQELYQPFLDELLAAQKPKPKPKPKSNPTKPKAGAA